MSAPKVIDRLQRAGLVEIHTREQAPNRPVRTIYQITDMGRSTGQASERVDRQIENADHPATATNASRQHRPV